MEINKIHNIDCLEGMKRMKSASVDLIVSDPPYGYSFMGKDWDKVVVGVDIWKECLRVLKDGAFAFIMSSPRQDVQSKMIVNIENAGFNIGFTPIYWTYASGFPKASNISKMVDKKLGAERVVVGKKGAGMGSGKSFGMLQTEGTNADIETPREVDITISTTPEAKALDGSYAGFQPKPAVEIILVAMKPITEKTYVEQALKNGKGITWLDDVRIPYVDENDRGNPETCPRLRMSESEEKSLFGVNKLKSKEYREGNLTYCGDGTGKNNFSQYIIDKRGRFPANLICSDDVLNDGNVSKGDVREHKNAGNINKTIYEGGWDCVDTPNYKDSGSFSRYFDLDKWFINKLPKSVQDTFPFLIVSKASSGEKNKDLDGFEEQSVQPAGLVGAINKGIEKPRLDRRNIHPTVKPIQLMSYLITLGSRENDLILDPFMGSGTTAISSRLLTRNFIGFEKDKEYHKIAVARLKKYMDQTKLGEF